VPYKVIFLGLSVIGAEEETRLLGGLQKKFNLTPGKAESLLQRVPIVVKRGVSREEAERYVKAFEAIGGRVQVEEERIPNMEVTQEYEPKPEPKPSPGREPKPADTFGTESEKKPYAGGMVTCPQCGFEQPKTDECIKCGIIISKYVQFQEMARSVEGQVREVSKDEYVPWESGEGFIRAFFQTVWNSLFSPTKFFKKVASGAGYWISLVYGLICGAIAACTNFLWVWLFFSVFFQLLPPQFSHAISFFSSIVIIILLVSLPIFEALTIFIASLILHLCLIIVGGKKKGFETTFRAFSYANSARLFYAIPFFIIPFLAPILYFALNIYHLVLIIIGVREGHGISTGRAVLAVLLPLIVIVGLGILAAILFPLLLRPMGFFGGVRT
jgi:hypothetical protein